MKNIITWIEAHLKRKQLIVLLSFMVGVFTALAALVLKNLIELIAHLLTHGFDITHINWLYLVYPAIGVLLSAIFIRYVVRDDIGHGVTKI
ncbi:MAG: chloride channel protein, partial [Bacteroidaceae bacterium]|nr:chloride channel protein [Bacteroidaceae bacterium]